jgi:hypothetical protein
MAARIGPASLRRGPRSVYICAPSPQTPDANHHDLIDAALKSIVRADDRLLYPSYPGAEDSADSVISFALNHNLFADPMAGEDTPPDLVIVIVDPLGDNELLSPARLLAMPLSTDLIITELPIIIG